jgi:hypothetical protein
MTSGFVLKNLLPSQSPRRSVYWRLASPQRLGGRNERLSQIELDRSVIPRRTVRSANLIDIGRNQMFGKRDAQGRFKEMDDVGRSLAADRRHTATTEVTSGHGDQGDRLRGAKKR